MTFVVAATSCKARSDLGTTAEIQEPQEQFATSSRNTTKPQCGPGALPGARLGEAGVLRRYCVVETNRGPYVRLSSPTETEPDCRCVELEHYWREGRGLLSLEDWRSATVAQHGDLPVVSAMSGKCEEGQIFVAALGACRPFARACRPGTRWSHEKRACETVECFKRGAEDICEEHRFQCGLAMVDECGERRSIDCGNCRAGLACSIENRCGNATDFDFVPPRVMQVERTDKARLEDIRGEFIDALEANFKRAAGVIGEDGAPFETHALDVPVWVAVVDSSPDSRAGVPGPGVFGHGEAVAYAVLRAAGCDNHDLERGACPVRILHTLALTRSRDATRDVSTPTPAGGGFGYWSDLASAIVRAVDAWKAIPERQRGKLIVNISAGWEKRYTPSTLERVVNEAQRAVHDSIAYARCSGAIVYAAAGNSGLGSPPPDLPSWLGDAPANSNKQDLVYPAAWWSDTLDCAKLGFGGSHESGTTLLEPVSAVNGANEPNYNVRIDGQTRTVAYGDSVAFRRVDGSFTNIYNGSSMATAVASGVAALVWGGSQDASPTEVVEHVYAEGVRLRRKSNAGPTGEARRVSCLDSVAPTWYKAAAPRPGVERVPRSALEIGFQRLAPRPADTLAVQHTNAIQMPGRFSPPESPVCALCAVREGFAFLDLYLPTDSPRIGIAVGNSAVDFEPSKMRAYATEKIANRSFGHFRLMFPFTGTPRDAFSFSDVGERRIRMQVARE